MYKTAIIGVSGYRARGHAEAYKHITRGKLVAVSTRQRDHLDAFATAFKVPARYTDYREMFSREKPDLVHVNTPPNVRVEVMQAADEAGIPALIVEKPIALDGKDYRQLVALSKRMRTKVAVNHQLHFHANRHALQQRVAAGELGGLTFVDASAKLTLVHQGTHMLEAIGAFLPGATPVRVFAQVGGVERLAENTRAHYSPDHTLAMIDYDSGVRATLSCGMQSHEVRPGDKIPYHKRISVYGERGSAHWTMWSWRITVDGRTESGEHEYGEQDIRGQAAMTEAMFDWMENDTMVHPLHLEAALSDFNTLLGIYTSGVTRRPIDLPCEPPDDLIDTMRRTLGRG